MHPLSRHWQLSCSSTLSHLNPSKGLLAPCGGWERVVAQPLGTHLGEMRAGQTSEDGPTGPGSFPPPLAISGSWLCRPQPLCRYGGWQLPGTEMMPLTSAAHTCA